MVFENLSARAWRNRYIIWNSFGDSCARQIIYLAESASPACRWEEGQSRR